MKTTIEFKENAQGNVEANLQAQRGPATRLEIAYTEAVIKLLCAALPRLGEQLGAKAAIFSDPKARPQNQ